MDTEKKETTIYFLKMWLSEVISNSQIFLLNTNKSLTFENTFYKRMMFDEHYILTATVMSVRFSKQLVDHSSKDIKQALVSFIENTKDAVDVRDMREHSDEYFLGRGRKQKEFFKGSDEHIQCDMSSSVQNECGYMLGNLIAMETIKSECNNLLNLLTENT